MDNSTLEESELLSLEIITSLIENKQNRAKLLADYKSNTSALKAGSWDLAPKLCELLTEENASTEGFVETCEYILLRLCDVGNVKELLLVLLEQADRFNDDVRFITLLAPLQKCLLGLSAKRGHSVSLVLETLYAHISQLDEPEEQNLEVAERKLLDSHPAVCRTSKVLTPFLTFLEPLVQQAPSKNIDIFVMRQKDELVKCLINILSHPLRYLDLAMVSGKSDSNQSGSKSNSRILAEKVMEQLATLVSNFALYILLTRVKIEKHEIKQALKSEKTENSSKMREENEQEKKKSEDEEKELVPKLGVSVFAYLIFSEHLQPDHVPQIMTYQYWLEVNFPFIICLLEETNWLVQEKGVSLLGAIVSRIPTASLPCSFLSMQRMKLLVQSLVVALCTGQNQELSQTALKHFTTLMMCFEPLGRHQFIVLILKKSVHAGINGYVVTHLKELIDQNLRLPKPDENFCGERLAKLLKFVFTLPDAERTDLMEHCAYIMSALNLLRYLIIRDKPSDNVTHIWTILPHIEKSFCENVRIDINMSRAHYQCDLKRAKDGRTVPGESELEYSIGSTAASGLNKEQKIQMLNMALHTFDMMESVLGRITELTTQAHRPC